MQEFCVSIVARFLQVEEDICKEHFENLHGQKYMYLHGWLAILDGKSKTNGR